MPLNNPSISSILSHLVHVDPKMNKPNYYHHYIIFILSVLLHLSVCHSSSSLYNTCFPKTCGDVSISYPFHIAGEQKTYCGYPGFEVTCQNGSNRGPYLNISGYNYLIKKIWYENQTFEVVNSVFLNTKNEDQCADSIRNLTFVNGLFEFDTNHNDLLLLIKCPAKYLSEYKQSMVNCGALAVGENDPGFVELKSKCDRVAAVPYEDDIIIKNGNFEEALQRGVVLSWMGTENCSDCAKSGGQCGFDQTLSKFQCYCSDRPHSHQCHKGTKLPLALGLGIPSGAVIVLIVIAIFWYRKRLKPVWKRSVSRKASLDRSTSDVEKGTIYFGVPVFSYAELKEATHSFHDSKELGDGGFGTVYYGKLKDGREVAVKRLYEKSCKRVEQFMNEVRILTCLKHQNLVSLYGCTSTNSNELLLVYEYVPNGTVADHLYGDKANNSPGGSLPWHIRLNIAVETASALAYLHASDIIHRDVKTNNILLDNNFNVKVADFGLSRLFPNDVTHVSTAPQGTPGYLDPEYHQCYQLTGKSDVYSFGVVLVELISSLPAVDMDRHRHEINLSNYAMSRIQRCAFDELVDQRLGFESDSEVRRMTTAVAELAFQCLQHDKEFRPSMDEVLETLRRIQSSNYDQEDKNDGGSVVVKHATIPPPSPNSQKDDIKLLTRHSHGGQHVPPSPDSVMDKWGSRLTTPSSSK